MVAPVADGRLSVQGRTWLMRRPDETAALAISQHFGLSEIAGLLLAARGVAHEDVQAFIDPKLRHFLPDPSHLKDMDKSAARLADAILEGEEIGIIGDYDVDGATSSALMARYLRHFAKMAKIIIPDRLGEGYGASSESFARLAGDGCQLVLTLDNGTTAFAPLADAAEAGQDVIVVDHHLAEERLPPAFGVINPNRGDQVSPLGHLAAVGVTFVLLVAVNRELRRRRPDMALPDPMQWLDLVALGTICDVVPLLGLNRAFVRQGLKILERDPLPGIRALAATARIEKLSEAWHLGFALGPRINACSRMGGGDLGLQLLLCEDAAEAESIALQLDGMNQERQSVERAILAAAQEATAPQVAAGRRVLLVAGQGWHAGVIGIVASRLVELHARPVFVVAVDSEGLGKGSARSVPGFDVGAAVIAARQQGLLLKGGGHAMAAGLTVMADQLPALADFFESEATALAAAGGLVRPPLEIDAAISTAGVTGELALDLERLAPYGPGHPEPRFTLTDARIVERREVGTGHMACTLVGTVRGRVKAIAFRCKETPLGEILARADGPLRLAGRIRADRWNGQLRAQFEIEDAMPTA
ncbi:exonuclease RecJ [Arboricoccus pini]|uniref:Single-stranded-DNA-specific exonuclease RecJ n=2 Tax=Arboricoccus pini TaxID=1963835 RepID=A0A212QUS2_9PROT|nr:exonuclease RecJ [Arboricoccus pini]